MKKYKYANPSIQISPTDIVKHMLDRYGGDREEVLNAEGDDALIYLFNEDDPTKLSNWDFRLLDALEDLYDLETVILTHFLED